MRETAFNYKFMRTLFYLLIILSFLDLKGQTKKIHIYKSPNGDNTLWYQWRVELCNQLELEHLSKSDKNWHFRVWTNKQVVEIWTDSNNKTNGRITSWTEEYIQDNKNSKARIFKETKELETIQVQTMISLVNKYQIDTIPDEHLIINWGQGFDGITYIIENSNLTDYYFKTYWTPHAQNNLNEALVIQSFIDSCINISTADSIWNDFANRIPFKCYINGGPMVTCKAIIIEKKKWRMNRRKKKHS